MFAVLEAGRFLYGDVLVDLITSVVYPEADLRLKGGLKRDTNGLGSWLGVAGSMSVASFLLLTFVILLVVAILHIPLPYEICDRHKVQFFEFLLRVSNEYVGNVIELLFGVRLRNYFTRFVAGIPYFFQSKPPKWCKIRVEKIAGVNCRVYIPEKSKRTSDSLLIFIHGGGWCIMKPRYYDGPLLSLIRRTGTPIVSIDYDLSPEKQFPHAILQCEGVIKELYEKKFADYKVNKEKMVLMGDSAGGNLTAVTCQRLKRQGKGHYIKSQILVYPVIHMFDFLSPSYQLYYYRYKGTALLNPYSLARWYLMYVGIEPSMKNIKLMIKNQHLHKEVVEHLENTGLVHHHRLPLAWTDKSTYQKPIQTSNSDPQLAEKFRQILTNPDICPIIEKDLANLPPALIMTAGIDVLRDEGVHYAARLKENGVRTRWNHYESAFHGVMNMPKSKQRKQMLDDIHTHLLELKLL
ncbi:unnamed protein product [Bursaphelenchus xylophilus]|nr:unnamed protein product [Bursaphelenchus xylophilus]CAG9130268.1 unnamed protein product [Bursaphelenchus xylophilus]